VILSGGHVVFSRFLICIPVLSNSSVQQYTLNTTILYLLFSFFLQLLSDLTAEQDYVKEELDFLRASAASMKQELEDIWKDEHEAVYELTSVFIHRGSTPQWGHYFFYSRHLPEDPDSWFKYNDSEVSVVSKEEVLADTTGSTANPYMLVFVRKGSDTINTVKRFDPMSLEEGP